VTVHRIDAPPAAKGLVIEPAVLRRLGLAGRAQLLLVRPDGHVGYRSSESGLGGLGRYLDRWLTAPGQLR